MDLKSQIELAQDLLGKGLITHDQLAVAQVTQKNLGLELTDILVNRGYISKELLREAISQRSGSQRVVLTSYVPSKELLLILPHDFICMQKIIPLKIEENKLILACLKLLNDNLLKQTQSLANMPVSLVLASEEDINTAIHKYFSPNAVAEREAKEQALSINPQEQEALSLEAESIEVAYEDLVISEPESTITKIEVDLEDVENQKTEQSAIAANAAVAKRVAANQIIDHGLDAAAVVDTVNKIFAQAVAERASDLHIEPKRENSHVRIRVDGILEQLTILPKSLHQKVLSRIKIMGKLDVAENRLPQDGSTSISIGKKAIDMRIATYPTTLGEAVAIRISMRENLLSLADMGLSSRDQVVFEKLINLPHGIFLVTGPTGSGKTTSLYAALNMIDRHAKHVLTVEDPAESEIEGVVQSQINIKAGITFPVILRSMLREDPDVIMVGEIRDQETAEISLRAAMTGHLVLSTLHTNSAIGSISRLQDLGLDTYLVSSTLVGVMAQRLVRRICQHCKASDLVNKEQLKSLGPKTEELKCFKGKGCEKCHHRGYKGRVGLFEVVQVDDEFKILINNRAPEVRLIEKAAAMGSRTMLQDGVEKISLGLTTVEEVLKVCTGA